MKRGQRQQLGALGLAAALLAWGWLGLVEASQGLTVGYTAISGEQAVLWVTKESGQFERYGLPVGLVFVEAGTKGIQALLAGDVPIMLIGGTAVILSNLAGADIKMLAGVINVLAYHFVTRPEITRPEQLRRGKVAVGSFGSLSDFGARVALESLRLDPERDVTILQIGAQTTRFAAVRAGSVQATVVAPPLTRVAKEVGFFTMVDLIALRVPFQGSGIAAPMPWVRRNPDLVRRFMKGLVAGIHFFKTQKEESIRITARYLRLDPQREREALAEGHRVFALEVIQPVPYPTMEGIQRILDRIAAREPRARAARPEALVDVTVLKELEQSGFVTELYARPEPGR